MKALKIASAAIAIVVIILALPLLFGLPIGFFTSAIQDRVERETGYRLSVAGSASLDLWPSPRAVLTDVTLQDPGDRDGTSRLTISRVKADVSLSTLWSGRPEIGELIVEKPTLHLPLLRERFRDIPPRSNTAAKSGDDSPVLIDRLVVTDGAVILSNPRDRVEERIDGIDAKAVRSADNKIAITGIARAAAHSVTFDAKADVSSPPAERKAVPVDFNLDMPGMLRTPLSGHAELRRSGKVVMINSLSGMLDGGAFNGWASVEIASKPLVKLDLDFQRLELGSSDAVATSGSQGWSTTPIDLIGLNYLDAKVKLSASELKASGAHLGPATVEASLAGGVLKATIVNLGAYDGQASGEIVIDATSGNPTYAMHGDLAGVRALPLLQNLADFDKLDARMQAKLALRSSGASQQAIMSNVSGSAFLIFTDGAIRGINIAQMIRSLTSNPLSGWQQSQELSTDLSQLSASFQVDRGQATTSDLNLIGPLVKVTGGGTIDLANKALALRVEPKLVLTTEGQGRTSDPVGLGIPVVVDGPWAQPRFYPDMAGILDDPDAAYARLKQMGQGLFGRDGAGLDRLINGIGGLIGRATSNGAASPDPGTPTRPGTSPDLLGGQLGAAIGDLIQQGLQQQGTKGRDRAPPPSSPSDPTSPAPQGSIQPPAQDAPQDSAPMNDVLKRLFNR
ncbi:AsmA family protein [Bradyrhizobium sp. STM 3557]|uniref:AsmA family protein n=1 Tax=Bradyrhizobium sp. STM 3557 TaxID=578920 RepID=UPI00388FAD50